jgi:hypothetical protein
VPEAARVLRRRDAARTTRTACFMLARNPVRARRGPIARDDRVALATPVV